MKFGQNIFPNEILDKLKNCSGLLSVIMKLGQKICQNDILGKFKNGSGWFKNMGTRGWGIFPYMSIYSYRKTWYPDNLSYRQSLLR